MAVAVVDCGYSDGDDGNCYFFHLFVSLFCFCESDFFFFFFYVPPLYPYTKLKRS